MYQAVVIYDNNGAPKVVLRAYPATYVDLAAPLTKLWLRLNSFGNLQFGSGLALLILSLPFIIGLERLSFGTPTRMGPGFVPGIVLSALLLIGIALILSGVTQGARSKTRRRSWDVEAFRGVASIAIGIIAFIVLLPTAGLIPAVIVTSLLCSLARPPFKLWAASWLALFNAAMIWLVFILFLDLPLRTFAGI
jgi:hypothetical protein